MGGSYPKNKGKTPQGTTSCKNLLAKENTESNANDRRRDKRRAFGAIVPRECADPVRRKRLEQNPAEWLKHYLGTAYPLAWGQVHLDMIDAAVRAIRTGAGMAVAAPRGTGKSSVLWGVALWSILSGACRFPVVAGWSHQAAKRALRKWLSTLAECTAIQADYPKMTQPFEASTHSNRLRGMAWSDTGAECGADARTMDGVLVLPDGRGALGVVSIGGNTRGLFASMPNGSTIRPDVLLVDDPQDRSTAESPAMVRKITERIEADLFNLSGPEARLAIMCAVTVIAEDDVAEHFLKHPDFEAVRVGQVVTWPVNFEDKNSATRKLWKEWNAVRVEGLVLHDDGAAAREFYQLHKTELTEGLTVSWSERFDVKRKDPDALYAAMLDFYRLGEFSFMAERQNRPMKEKATVYSLTAGIVASRVHSGRNHGDVPKEARILVAGTDLNHYGLHSASVAYSNDGTGWIPWYYRHDNDGRGIVPKDCPETEAKRRMFEALVIHGRQLAALPLTREGQGVRVGLWIIDAGYFPDVVKRYVEGPGRLLGLQVMAARGYGFDKYRPTEKNCIGKPREQCHLAESPVAGRFVAFNADYWREVSQRAWLSTPNAPGSISLFDGARHSEFAEQVTREKLLEKIKGQYGYIWRWVTAPGWHDYGDALTMCYVASAWAGIGTASAMGETSQAPIHKQYVEKRRCKVKRDDDGYL